jgi:broad specificity polyphosphatase/5'/3'-nucleotidase SurE
MQNFAARLSASPATWGQTESTASTVAAAVEAYATAYEAMAQARAEGTRSMAATAAKDATRRAALELVRPIYMGVQASYAISDESKILLGVKVPSRTRTAEPSPTTQVILTQVRLVNRTATFSLRDSGSESSRARPFGARGASVF